MTKKKDFRVFKQIEDFGDFVLEKANPINPIEDLIGGAVRFRKKKKK